MQVPLPSYLLPCTWNDAWILLGSCLLFTFGHDLSYFKVNQVFKIKCFSFDGEWISWSSNSGPVSNSHFSLLKDEYWLSVLFCMYFITLAHGSIKAQQYKVCRQSRFNRYFVFHSIAIAFDILALMWIM